MEINLEQLKPFIIVFIVLVVIYFATTFMKKKSKKEGYNQNRENTLSQPSNDWTLKDSIHELNEKQEEMLNQLL